MRTGFPFSLSGGNLNTTGSSYPDRVADGRLFGKANRQLWYDPTAFRRTECNIQNHPELCHYGNAATDVLISPGMVNFDMAFGKNWAFKPFGDKGRLQFRAEAFNFFNTPLYGQPNGIGFASNDSIIPDAPRVGEVYNMGGSRHSNCSMIEAIVMCEQISGKRLAWTYKEDNRIGDHIWWISDVSKFQAHYPQWQYRYDLRDILREIHVACA